MKGISILSGLFAAALMCVLSPGCSTTQQTVSQDAAPEPREEHTPGETMSVCLTGDVNMVFVWIPPGTFTMGSPTNEAWRSPDETEHEVTLTKGFWMGQCEVTHRQWEAVAGRHKPFFEAGPDAPVEHVTWADCQDFARKMSGLVSGRVCRLPTEAEWEYACRAGTTSPFHSGEGETNLAEAAWYFALPGPIHPVGQKRPNAFGLHDMHGNVREWCKDWYGDYPSNAVVDPAGPASGAFRVMRGGSWDDIAPACRSACRLHSGPLAGNGFRVVLVRREVAPPKSRKDAGTPSGVSSNLTAGALPATETGS